jgi:hypothetical protein
VPAQDLKNPSVLAALFGLGGQRRVISVGEGSELRLP